MTYSYQAEGETGDGKPKEIRGRHKRESKWMLMGMNANGRHAENYAHLLDPAAIACASRQTLPETAAVFRFLPDAFNQVACAAIIR